MADGFHALVRRRRDGQVVFDLDVVHAGVVAEALEQTRAVLDDGTAGSTDPAATAPVAPPGPDGPHGPGGPDEPDEFDAIVAGLSDVGDQAAADRSAAAELDRDDPVVRRLLPDAFMDDPEGSAEFRRLSGGVVRDTKVAAIDSVLADLALLQEQDGGLAVPEERAVSWLTALNDARLALGTLLAIGEDDDLYAELDDFERQVEEQVGSGEPEADPASAERALRAYRIAVYDFLSALLDMVVRVLDR